MKIKTIPIFSFFIFFVCQISVFGQEVESKKAGNNLKAEYTKKLKVEGYGVINYYNFDWETLPDKRNAIDPERFNLYLFHDFSDKIQFKSEIEFEHGGTGTTVSFDPLEEFGEFEQEIEKGGAVVLEQLNILFRLHKYANLRIGKMRLYMGNASKQDKPREYFTTYRSEIENTILPLGWYETGIEVSGAIPLSSADYPQIGYKAYVVSGLDNTGFSSFNWIKRGYQTRFETINANSLAYVMRVDYIFGENSEFGFSVYANNASSNRPKKDFESNSWVTYGDFHFALESNSWRFRAYGMIGHIQNSEALSKANRNLSNNLDVKRTPVAKMAGGAYGEVAYDVFKFLRSTQRTQLYVFTRLEWYDSMLKTEGTVSDNPRYERQIITAGINYFPLKEVVLKAHYAWRSLGSDEKENTFAMGIGFDF